MTWYRKGDWLWAVWMPATFATSYYVPSSSVWAYSPLIGLALGIASEIVLRKFNVRYSDNADGLGWRIFMVLTVVLWIALMLLDVAMDGYEAAVRDKLGSVFWPMMFPMIASQALYARKHAKQ